MKQINPQFLKMGLHQKQEDNIVQCLICERKCKITAGKFGYCQTRINKGGKIYSIIYGLIPAISFNPIEKKPLYHFYPGSIAITIGTYGCNFNCFWCQNHHLSHPKEKIHTLALNASKYIPPKEIVQMALRNSCKGTSVSFNEPTLLFEYSLELFKLAKKEGLYNTYVSNGYMTKEVLRHLINCGLDAINIDVKGDVNMVKKYCGAENEKIWRNIVYAKEHGVHVEITTLLLEGFNTNELTIKTISEKILKEVGEDTPFHISRAFPYYRSHEFNFTHSTPKSSLYNAREIAINSGLQYVYLGNVTDNDYQDTKCPNCSQVVIKRNIYGIDKMNLDKNGRCMHCGHFISII
ncbi:MAG: AmmeMemoRadiSam system radical SAM enzyme [Promethearchaeota archaeon]|nr:MAG: AmmeMemoRadiSam system radical SAM enzyme [Candidatus Lokiarchaeota archaeon]